MSADTQRGERERQRLERTLDEIRRAYLTMGPGEKPAAFTVGLEPPARDGESPRVRVVKA